MSAPFPSVPGTPDVPPQLESAPSDSGRSIDGLLAVALAAICLASYVSTLTPGLSFPVMDSHELALNAIRLGVAHPSGYPVYTWLGFVWVHLIPFGDAAYRMNLLSAAMGAVAIGCVFLMMRALGPRPLAAATAALLLGVSDTFWSQAVITEVYTANLGLQAATMLVLLRWARRVRAGGDGDRFFLAFALLFGTSLGTHLANLGFAPVYAAFVVAVDPATLRRPRLLGGALALFCLAAAQYGWLFLRGSRFDQYPNPQPDNWHALWSYTLGAFASMRFAYPVATLPLRLFFYLQQLAKCFTLAGVALGILGTWIALARAPFAFWLLFGIHVINVFVFAQFSVPDPEVFFLPGYVAWAAFVAFGLQGLFDGAMQLRRRIAPGFAAVDRAAYGVTAVGLAAALIVTAQGSRRANDRTDDTLVPDFDRNVYDLLPADSTVLAPRGVFGANMLYWQTADGIRPDVTVLGQRDTPRWDEHRPLYGVLRVLNGSPTRAGRMGWRDGDMPADAWYVPVLFGNARAMILSRVDHDPPPLVAGVPASVKVIDRPLGAVTLVGSTITLEAQAPSPRLHVRSWWRVPDARRVVVSTGLDERTLEAHLLGLENLARYAATVGLPANAVVHEDFHVVVPSTVAGGRHAARLGVTTFAGGGITTEWVDVDTVAIR